MKMFKILSHKYKDYLLIFILSLVPLLWYGLDANMLMASNDVGASMNPIELVKTRVFSWNSGINFGVSQTDTSGSIIYYGFEALAAFITGSIYTGQKIVIILWFLAIMLSIYICVRKIPVFRDKPYMALFASILFQFNHYQQHGWRVFWRTRFSSYILLPIMTILLVNFLEGKSKLLKTAVYMGLAVLLLNGGGSPPVYGANILLVLSIIFYYLITNLRKDFFIYLKRSIQFLLASGIVAFIMSSYWLFPYIYYTVSSYSQTMSDMGGISPMIMWTDVVSLNASVLNLMRNVGLPFWDTNLPDPKLFLVNPLVVAISFIWPILTFSAVFFAKKKEEKKYIVLFLIIAIVAILFTAGTHKPFKDFYIFLLYHIPGFVIFRSPLYKFGNLLWFSYAVLIAFTLSSMTEFIKGNGIIKKIFTQKTAYILPSIIIAFILVWDYPFFSNSFLIWRPPLTTMLKIPSYVIEYGNWVDHRGDYSSRTLLLPELFRAMPVEAYRWGYWSFGSQLFTLLTNKNSITNDIHAYTFDLEPEVASIGIDRIYTYLKNNDPNWFILAKEFGIRYLILRNDFYYDIEGTPTTQPIIYENNLSQDSRVEKVNTFGEWDLYRLRADYPAKKIKASTKPIFYLEKSNNILPFFTLIDQLNQETDKEIQFISANNKFEEIGNQDLMIIPGPMDAYLPLKKGELFLPNVKRLPGSLLYFTVVNKEKELIKKAVITEDQLKILTDFSLNRLAEIKELVRIKAQQKNIESVFSQYIFLLDEMKKNINLLLTSNKDSSHSIIRTKGYLIEEKKLLKIWLDDPVFLSVKNILEKSYQYLDGFINTVVLTSEQEAILTGLINPYYDPNIVFLNPEYKWRIPQDGTYEIYINKISVLQNSNKLVIQIDGNSIESDIDKNKTEDNWQKIGEINLGKGEQGLSIVSDGIILSSIKKGDIVFKKKKTDNGVYFPPQISYRRINPTKYLADVSSNGQTLVVLDEKFHPGWKLYLKKKFSDSYLSSKTNLIDKIKIFLDENIFNTLFMKPLSDDKHIEVNSYENAWYFDPQQMVDAKEYQIVIEYWPQRLIYFFSIISIVAIAGSIIYLIKSRN